ncbi:methyltransferase [Thalassotalea profundi]|uniref:Ribosomal RNA small subunit methyltransferase C n=1 Tax=Thalassotalea profundi TaxID=2036687 RepID=A0ABQ3IUE1_9GAMM|nr:methyltransferase [Thalassotalea profundi]GHE93258.1 ribosomal RNA small subunit methyltransferase C [Thalassotalea profundi]
MSLTNISQLLMRNQDLLIATQPLLVNMPDDNFARELLRINPMCDLTVFDNNYANHLAHQKATKDKHTTMFDAYYHNTIKHDLIVIYFPKSKKELPFTLAMLNHVCTDNTRILIVGENNGGIKSLASLENKLFNYCEKIDSARHCVLFEIGIPLQQKVFNIEDWFEYYTVEINQCAIQVASLPGVFSQAKLDVGTRVLLENLPNVQKGELLDFGCGAGVIAAFIGKNSASVTLSLTDVSALALMSAEKTLTLNNLVATIFPTDSLSNIKKQYQHVISNPPFHQGIKTHYLATEDFLKGISKHIIDNGSLTIVANSFLQYQPIMEKAFAKVSKLKQEKGFSIYHSITSNKR